MRRKTGLRLDRWHNLALPLFAQLIARPVLPIPRPACDWGVGVFDWKVLANNTTGCCVASAVLHGIMGMSAATGRPVPALTDSDALALYKLLVPGFDPADPGTDLGSDFDTAGAIWQQQGVLGHTILSRFRVNRAVDIIKLANDWTGFLYVGGALPDDAEDQFDAGVRWTPTPGKPPNPDNGHEILLTGYDADGPILITWGKEQRATWAWFLAFTDPHLGGDVQGVITEDWIREIGLSPSELHLTTIRRDADLLLAS